VDRLFAIARWMRVAEISRAASSHECCNAAVGSTAAQDSIAWHAHVLRRICARVSVS
jgi:hypothetical protein